MLNSGTSILLETVPPSSQGLNVVLLIGVAIFLGAVGGRIFRRLHIPQIIGYMTVGIVLGPVLQLVSSRTVEALEPFNMFALGLIGFLIGGELKRDIFVKFGKQVSAILAFEGGVAFLLVVFLTFVVLVQFWRWQTALAASAVFGAICAATDPASTVNVLWEYKTRGPLTTMLTAIVALDDALAMVLYILSVSVGSILTGRGEGTFLGVGLHAVNEIAGSLVVGAAAGGLLRWIIKRLQDDEVVLLFTLGTISLTIGLAKYLRMDVILSAMALGVTLVNSAPRRSLRAFELVRKFSPPVYVLFFVLIGARFAASDLSGQVWLLVGAYVIGSTVGKTTGSWLGAVYSKSVPAIRKYLGFCLYQQGTIAVALLLMATQRFEGEVRDTMLSVIVIGVFILQLAGPLFVKIGVKKAGEVGLNVTEEDLVKSYSVGDVMDTSPTVLVPGLSLREVIKTVSATKSFYYPVIDDNKRVIGAITLDGIRNTFTTQELNDWLVALDVVEPIIAKVTPQTALAEAFDLAGRLGIEYVTVTRSAESDEFVGLLDCRAVRRALSAEVLARQQKADNIHSAQDA